MEITNRLDLPKAFVSMVDNNYEYKPNQYSVTSLLSDSLRETMLKRRYHKQTEQDVAEMIWMLFGNAVHYVLEQSREEKHELKEEYLKVEVIPNYYLSGVADLYNELSKKITDYKTCSVWKVVHGSYEDWRKQTLIYCWMIRKLGFEANKGEIVAVMKDHSKAKAKFDRDYPQFPVKVINFEFNEKDFQEIDKYLIDKFNEIKLLENVADDKLPMCSLRDRFNKGDMYAIKKKKNKRATKIHESMEKANKHLELLGDEYEIEIRKGEDKKCLEYCSVCKFCNYYNENYKSGGTK